MTRPVLPVSIVIPVRNESASLDELFASLDALSPKPAEVVFVDTGSTDGSAGRIEHWFAGQPEDGIRGQLCLRPGAYPGAARNTGVAAAGEEWIAFLDAGISPEPAWLGALWQYRLDAEVEAVYGCCRFGSDEALGRMLCAASYGVGRLAPVLPASLFHRALFQRAGEFAEHLRAGEDILWKQALQKIGIDVPVCERAIVEYRHFAPTLAQALRKQFVYEQSALAAGVGGGARAMVLGGVLVMYAALFVAWQPALSLLTLYLLLRGVADPIRRSRPWSWWSAPWQIVALPVVAALLDLSAAVGRVTALAGVTSFRRNGSVDRRAG